MCKDRENYIMSTYLVTDKTIKASEEIIRRNKEFKSSNSKEQNEEIIKANESSNSKSKMKK